eukprot:TRINITY_DN6579_c0_g1_i1.p5 TRINITY_DN6579_c0_g1~~TRINITY_DN6579_c0_g1_i1.p5  ORF type:complete len:116 (+),score=5.73 TRINITY_DN6579_c0_g1_i1:289-636(+)
MTTFFTEHGLNQARSAMTPAAGKQGAHKATLQTLAAVPKSSVHLRIVQVHAFQVADAVKSDPRTHVRWGFVFFATAAAQQLQAQQNEVLGGVPAQQSHVSSSEVCRNQREPKKSR